MRKTSAQKRGRVQDRVILFPLEASERGVHLPRKSQPGGEGPLPLEGPAAEGARAPQPAGEVCRAAESSLSNLEFLLRRSLDDAEFRAVTWHKFVARAGDCAGALRRAFESANAVELAREAHTLKEVAAALTANELYAASDALERTATGGDRDEARAALERVCAEIERCAAGLR
jgi:HPt (histidine-containing phosphotransfer) domain-containing protein